MVNFPLEFNQSKETIPPQSLKALQDFYAHIEAVRALIKQTYVVDQVLLSCLRDLKASALVLIQEFNEQKSVILKRFNQHLLPIAQEVLNTLLLDAEKLTNLLDDYLNDLSQISSSDWVDYTKHWAQLYAKWHNHKALIDTILDTVVYRTTHLINKDIQVVQEYQAQFLSHLSKESTAFKSVEIRLIQAIEQPLKQLAGLRNPPKDHTLQQISEWVVSLHMQREDYFDQLLMKIDYVMKDVVVYEENEDLPGFVEIEGEIVFMKKEFQEIQSDFSHLQPHQKEDLQFIKERLLGLLEHIEQLEELTLTRCLHKQVLECKEWVTAALLNIKHLF